MAARLTDDELARLIETSPSLDALTEELEPRGISLSIRKLKKSLAKAWKNRPSAHEIASDEPLPATVVHVRGVEYHVHGILHGQRRVLKVGEEVLREIRYLVESWDSPPRSAVGLERGFSKLVGIDERHDLHYTRDFLRRVGIGGVLRVLLVLPLIPFAPIAFRFSRDPMTRALPTAMKDMAGLRRYRGSYLAEQLPARIGIELSKRSGERFRIAHSEAQAAAAIERASTLGVAVMHVVVGLAHEREVAYLLSSSADD
jgi:hypothetical protein